MLCVIIVSGRKLPATSKFNYIRPFSVIEIHIDKKSEGKISLFISLGIDTIMYAKKHKYKYVIFMHWKFNKSSLEKHLGDSIFFLNPSLIDKAYGFVLMKLYKEKNKNT